MRKFLFLKFFSLVSGVLLLCPGILFSQHSEKFHFSFSGEKASRNSLVLGEYRISLGSQMPGLNFARSDRNFFFPGNLQTFPSPEPEKKDLILHSSDWEKVSIFGPDEPGNSPRIAHDILQNFNSTLTLTAGYGQDSKPWGFLKTRSLGAQKKIGRWAVYGEVRREEISQIPSPEKKSNPAEFLSPLPLANISSLRKTPSGPAIFKTLDPVEIPENVSNLALNNYYLEAIYNFHPDFQGKVSYKKSLIETFDKDEKLQFEGIVGAGKDVFIKAGYRNTTSPELKDKKPSNDTKVWTEFILKF